MSYRVKLTNKIKKILYGEKGEPFKINNVKLFFQPGSRPVRSKYVNSKDDTVRNDVLQLQYFTKMLKPDSVFWDIGSHFGTYSLFASSYISNNDSIFAFEPDEKAILTLRKNLKFNNLVSKVKVMELAVSSQTGKLNFDMQDGNANSHLITNNSVKIKGHMKLVNSTTLDEMSGILPKPDFIKIDTEGAELDIIKGGKILLSEPNVIFVCELHPFAWPWFKNVSWEDFVTTLKRYNRVIRPLDPLKKLVDLPYYGTVIF